MGSPPLARGTARRYAHGVLLPGITPACAGNRVPTCAHQIGDGDHPRLRGEQCFWPVRLAAEIGSPPLARGTVDTLSGIPAADGITPACAGNRCGCGLKHLLLGDHPRLRGEQMLHAVTCAQQRGSPPLARGTALDALVFHWLYGITPACAGNSKRGEKRVETHRDHPRLRGEQQLKAQRLDKIRGSPPLARGTGNSPVLKWWCRGITPACAGNSGFDEIEAVDVEDHPRLRGEQPSCR